MMASYKSSLMEHIHQFKTLLYCKKFTFVIVVMVVFVHCDYFHCCLFYADAVKQGIFTNKVMDIEDLATLGMQRNACPYYAAREISKQSDCSIIFTPYNYLLDKRARRSHNLEIGGNIIIFDEAHNLVKTLNFFMFGIYKFSCDSTVEDIAFFSFRFLNSWMYFVLYISSDCSFDSHDNSVNSLCHAVRVILISCV